MKRPATKTLVMGHPLVATPMTLACAAFLLAGVMDGSGTAVVLTMPVLISVLGASQQAAAYRAWVREWEAMEGTPPRRAYRWPQWLVLAAAVIGVLVFVGSDSDTQHSLATGAGLLVAGLVAFFALCIAISWMAHRRKVRAGSFAVRIVARRSMATPSLTDAYRALPSYCQALLLGGQP
jgi:hypothetical protein